MTEEEHKQDHIKLHRSLDRLVADMAHQTGKLLTEINAMELIEWSYKQTLNPTVKEPY